MISARLPWPTRKEYPYHSFFDLLNEREYLKRARCADKSVADWRWFFAERTSAQKNMHQLTESEVRAKACCAQCPVQRECLSDGLYEPAGVWGGTLASERTWFRHHADCHPGTMVKRRDHIACVPDIWQVEQLLFLMRREAQDRGLVAKAEECV